MWIRAIFFLTGYFLVAIYPMAPNSGIHGPSIDDIIGWALIMIGLMYFLRDFALKIGIMEK